MSKLFRWAQCYYKDPYKRYAGDQREKTGDMIMAAEIKELRPGAKECWQPLDETLTLPSKAHIRQLIYKTVK